MPLMELVSGLQTNPYFGAGFGLVGLGAGAALLRRLTQAALMVLRRRYLMTLEVPCRDKSYQWLLQWITVKAAKDTQHLSVETVFQQNDSGLVKTSYDFIPSVGTHFFSFKNRWVKVDRERAQQTLDLHMGVPFETVTLTTVGKGRWLFAEILEEARVMALSRTEGKTVMYTAMGGEWRTFGHPRRRRPIDSVILDDGVSSRVLADINDFLGSAAWYNERGIPYRRGYLLHGPPGCGKSSFITAVAGHLNYGICVLNLSDRGLSDDRLNHLLNVAPHSCIILLEDIDAAFVSREEAHQSTAFEGLNRVTFSGLLNCLDGVASSEARVLFMTTNYLNRLDPALIRPGRVDKKEYIGYCSKYQLATMFSRFYKATPQQTDQFTQQVLKRGLNVSPAQIQGYFMRMKTSTPEEVIQNVQLIWEDDKAPGVSPLPTPLDILSKTNPADALTIPD